MGEYTNDNEEVNQPDEVDEALERIRINPRKVLESLGHLRIDRARIKPIESKALDRGGTADVEPAILAPAQSSSSSGSDDMEYVAVKKLRLDAEDDDGRALASFAHEANLLSDLSHENVVNIIGFVEDVEHGVAWMVFTWEKNGNLREFVRSANWELPERVSLIGDVARGLSYLHGRHPPICHGDMKSLNILVNSEYRAVITDFGSARPVGSTAEPTSKTLNTASMTEPQPEAPNHAPVMGLLKAEVSPLGEFITMTGPAWTVRWAAPELLAQGVPGLASDIWALGWICWEAITGNFPFDSLEDCVAVVVRIVKGDLPVVKNNDQLRQIGTLCGLMEECWRVDAKGRPTAVRCQQVVSFMNQALPSPREGSNPDTPRSSGLLYALGLMREQNGNMPEALKYFRQALEVSKSVGDEQGAARALQALGDAYLLQSEYTNAEELLIQARNVYSQIEDSLGFAQSVKGLGDVYRMRSEYLKAEESYTLARDIFLQLGYQHGLAQLLRGLGDVYQIRGEYSKAEESYTQARSISSEIGSQLGFAHSVKSLGDAYYMRDEYSKSEESYIQARDLYSQFENQLGFAQSVNSLGDVYRMRCEYSKSEELYLKARDSFTEIGDQLGSAQSLKSLGDVYCLRDEYSKAEESLIQARNIYSQIGYPLGYAQSVRSLGDVYRMRDEYSKAEESYIQARDVYSQMENQLGFAQAVHKLGDVYCGQGEYSKAEESYIQARDIFSQVGDELGFAQVVDSLGDVYRIRGECPQAEQSYIQARNVFSQVGDQLGVASSTQGLGRVYTIQGEYAKAEESYLEAQQIYTRIGAMRSSANILWFLGWLHYERAQYGDAERSFCEASMIYGKLGLEEDVVDCDELLEQIRRLKEK